MPPNFSKSQPSKGNCLIDLVALEGLGTKIVIETQYLQKKTIQIGKNGETFALKLGTKTNFSEMIQSKKN